MKEIVLNIPTQIETPRLILRAPRAGDGKEVNEAIVESFENLREWIPWAKQLPTPEETEEKMRLHSAQWILRESFNCLIVEKASNAIIGCAGIVRPNWDVRCFEIGYWLRAAAEGKGFVTESTNALTQFAFRLFGANRVELRFDPLNKRSIKVAERLGFEYEGHLRRNAISPKSGDLRDTLVYSRLNQSGLPALGLTF